MYTLYFVPDWASLSVRLVLEELGVDYDAKLVDNESNERDSEEFRKLSPLGLIPALKTPDGPMFETMAILLWLADKHGAMAPAPGSPERASFLKWFVFSNNTVHNLMLNLFHPERVSSMQSEKETLDIAREGVRKALFLINQMVEQERPYWLSSDHPPSVFSYYIALLMRWMNGFESGHPANISSADYPALHAILLKLENREVALRCAEKEGLGKTIFTNPTLV
jgi:glutathione S-transferase